MDQWRRLFVKYRQVIKNGVVLCVVIAAIFCKTEKLRFLCLGAASGVLVVSLVESVDRLRKSDAEKVTRK